MKKIAISDEEANDQLGSLTRSLSILYGEACNNMEYIADKFIGVYPISMKDWGKYKELENRGGYVKGLIPCYNTLQKIIPLLLQVKKIPPTYTKLVEKAYKETSRKNKFDMALWFAKNQDIFDMALNLAPKWETMEALSIQEESIGNLRVINQTTEDITKTETLLRNAIKAIKASQVPNLTKVLYGDVFLTGQMSRKVNTVAWYFYDQDYIQIFKIKKFDKEILSSLIHEFGHRYWQKFMSDDVKQIWNLRHEYLSGEKRIIPDPIVGQPIPGVKGSPRLVEKRVNRNGRIEFRTENNGIVDYVQWKHYMESVERERDFPTPYAVTNPIEHFCDALGMYCTGTLPSPHKEAFEAIVIRGEMAL